MRRKMLPALAAVLLVAAALGCIRQASAQDRSGKISQPDKSKAAPDKGQKVQRKQPSHRSLRQGMFDLTTIEFASVVMLGDSLTERAQWHEITGCHFVANRGIGADDSAGVLRRLGDVVKLKPSAVFLNIGVNDVASNVPTEKIVDNVRQIVERLTAERAHIFLTLVLPVTQSYSRKINPKIDELNAGYKKLAERQNNVSILDFRRETQADDGALIEELSIDGIHLSPAGYRVWRDAIKDQVAQYCPPKPVLAPRPPPR